MTLNPSSKSDSTVLAAFDLNSQFDERYTIGVDLGQANDSTAIAVVRKIERFPDKPVFQVGHLRRVALGTPYPAIVVHVMDMLARPRFRGKAELVIDMTGVGRPVFDMFQGYGASPIGVLITGGDSTTRDGSIYRVPKITLVSRLQALLHDQRLHIHKDIPEATALVNELQNFRAEYSETGYIRFNARNGKHDDLVLALAIALWRAHGDGEASFGNWLEYMRRNAYGVAVAAATSKLPLVKLQRPKHIGATHLITATGRNVTVAHDGTVELSPDEAQPLVAQGWQQIEAAA
jgi:hypothetical protein